MIGPLRLVVFVGLVTFKFVATADDLLIEDFESDTFRQWNVAGDAFGRAPAKGTLPNQNSVTGYRGDRLLSSFHGGDGNQGTATSPSFTIRRSHIAFLIGGGSNQDKLSLELIVAGKPVRRATGSKSEALEWSSWDVREFADQKARLRVVDAATAGWGHISVDHLIQTNDPPQRFDLDSQLEAYRASPNYLNEPLRPRYHFSPEINWMNDPNGLVFHDGEYHLFYQYNPAGNSWGHMSWGHAVSRDLTRWQHLPLAIPEENGVMAFSGCCVIDRKNTSGFGDENRPPMVAIYTGHGHGKQVQNIAFSTDNGRSWTKYEENPVLDIASSDFRDPKVFWHEPTRRWVMVVSLAIEKVIVFYSSPDLKEWTELSRFGPAGTRQKPNWECPDLFQLPIQGESGKTLWVLEVDMGGGSIAGGSGGEYFVGQFDGTRFKTIQSAQWVDYGRDFYAPVSWSNLPPSDGRHIWIGWFNNWETCLVPTSPWRSCMSVPRSLNLKKVAFNEEEPATYVLVQQPVKELVSLRTHTRQLDTANASWPPVATTEPGELDDLSFELETVLKPGRARSLGLRIRTGDDEYTEVGYDRRHLSVYVDRQKSGNVAFHKSFAGRHEAPTRLIEGEISLRLLVDRSSIEVFVNDGEAVISDRIFPTGRNPTLEFFKGDDSADFGPTSLHTLRSIHPSLPHLSGASSPTP